MTKNEMEIKMVQNHMDAVREQELNSVNLFCASETIRERLYYELQEWRGVEAFIESEAAENNVDIDDLRAVLRGKT